MKRIFLTTILLVCAYDSVSAQKPKSIPDRELQQRRATAISLLQSLAVEARSYQSEPLRARMQAKIADVMWTVDKEEASALFRRAWEVAETVDTNTGVASVPGRAPANRPSTPRLNLRREILLLASRRDVALGEEFLNKLTNKDSAETSTTVSPVETAERLRVATEFLERDDVSRAIQFAGPALINVRQNSIQFLIALRQKDAAAADQRFRALLIAANNDSSSDANTVSLFTSYVFTPWTFLVVSPEGIPSSTSYPLKPVPELDASLRQSYFSTASSILVRPVAQIDQSTAGRRGTHFIIIRLLPLFQKWAPDMVASLNAQLAALGPEAVSGRTEERPVNRTTDEIGVRPSVEDELQEQIDRAKTYEERDRAYAFAAMRAADRGELRAQDWASKIEDTDTRKGVTTFVNYSLILGLVRKKQTDQALQLIAKLDLPHTLRSNFLVRTAAQVIDTDRVRGAEIIDEALAETRRIESAAERTYSLVGLLVQMSKLNKTRTWELLSETVRNANSVSDFTGEAGRTTLRLEGKIGIQTSTELAGPDDFSNLFQRLASEGFYQALDVAKTLRGEAPRAVATIAVAKSVLGP